MRSKLLAALALLLFWAPPALAVPAFKTVLGNATTVAASASTQVVITTTANIDVGDFIWVGTGENTTPDCTAVATFNGTSGDSLTRQSGASASVNHISTFVGIATVAVPAGGTITATCHLTTTNKVAYAASFTGVTATRDTTASGTASSTGTTVSVPGATMANTGELVIATAYVNVAATGITADNFTSGIQYGSTGYAGFFPMSYTIGPSTTALTWTASLNNTRLWAGTIDAYVAAAAPSGGTYRSLTGVGR